MQLRKNKNVLFISIILLTLSSCGIFKSVDKKKLISESIDNVSINKEVNSTTVDKSKITIKESIDTVIKSNEISLNVISEPQIDSINSYDLVIIDNDIIKVTQSYDSKLNKINTKINIKEKENIVKMDRITTIDSDKLIAVNSKSDSLNTEYKYNKDISVEKKPDNNILLIIIIVLILSFIIIFKNKL